MAYCGYSDLLNVIDQVNLAAMTQDIPVAGNIAYNVTLLTSICQQASNACDAYIASIYATPFATPPATIKQASIIFAAEILYQRRLTPEERNPFKSQADTWRDRLQKIGSGMLPLDESYNRGFTPVVYDKVYNKANSSIM